MTTLTIYHNPRCSKSRQALEILNNHGIYPIIIEYLKNPLSLEEIKKIRAHFTLQDFVRQEEPVFKTLNLTLDNEPEVLHVMEKEPILMQRPIITDGKKAIIARPPEKVLAFIQENKK